jgi:hypothetical protein
MLLNNIYILKTAEISFSCLMNTAAVRTEHYVLSSVNKMIHSCKHAVAIITPVPVELSKQSREETIIHEVNKRIKVWSETNITKTRV